MQRTTAFICVSVYTDLRYNADEGNKPPTEQHAQQEREKFVMAFNDTMLRIWQEQITLLGVIDTGALLASPKALPVRTH